MSKQDWARVRDAVLHGMTTRQWSQLHNLGLLLWAAGEAGAQLS